MCDTLHQCVDEIQRESRMFYVYVLMRPCGTPFYVGKGSRDRICAHERDANRGKSGHRMAIIRSIWQDGLDVLYKIDSFHDDDQGALTREIELISIIGRNDLGNGPLVNFTPGGDGVRSPTDEMRNHQRRIKLQYYIDHPEERLMISERTRKQLSDPAARDMLSRNMKRRLEDPDTKEALRQASVAARQRNPQINTDHSMRMSEYFANPINREKLSKAWTPEKRAAQSERRRAVLSKPGAMDAFVDRIRKVRNTAVWRDAASKRTAEYYNKAPDARRQQSLRTKEFFSDPDNMERHRNFALKQQAEKRVVIARCIRIF